MLTVDLGTYDRGLAFVVAVPGVVTSGNAGAGGDGTTQGDGGAHECPAVELDTESVVHWFH